MKRRQIKPNHGSRLPRLADITDLVLYEVADQLSDDESLRAIVTGIVPKSIVDRRISTDIPDVHEFRKEYWKAECLSKFPFQIEGVDRAGEALTGFYSAEERCRQANLRLGFFPNPYCMTSAVVRRARKRLKWLLSGISRTEVMQRANWGPGSSTKLSRRKSQPQIKWVLASHCTESCLPWVKAFGKWAGREFSTDTVIGNYVTSVPKNAKTDRIIAIEPDWNCFFQLGLGSAIRRRLQRVGQLLPDAADRNKRLARAGSISGAFATVDLKSASDTLSLQLCALLLPSNVLEILGELRSPYGVVGEHLVEYEKVSSMGNGATFELETAMFWALATSCDPSGDAAVFGDDVIITSEAVPLFVEVLTDLGMEVNEKKTHFTGPFRESCGGHFYRGIDVTPPYFKKRVVGLPEYIRAHNKLQTFFGRSDTTAFLRSKVPRAFWGPASRGDTVLHSEWDETCPTWKPEYQSYQMKEIVEKFPMIQSPIPGAILHALWGSPSMVFRFGSRDTGLVTRVQSYQTCTF